jgi:hypothetical protein
VIIGMDPHKRSATIETVDNRERALGQGRFPTDTDRYRRMLALGRPVRAKDFRSGPVPTFATAGTCARSRS